VADGVGAGQPRLPPVSRSFRRWPLDEAHGVARARSRVVARGPGLLLPRRGPRERDGLLLPAGGCGRLFEDDIARPCLCGADGWGSGRCAGE
jgi:hypothetical protein